VGYKYSLFFGTGGSSLFALWEVPTEASSNPRTKEELTDNIRKEISNIAAENLQKVSQNLFRRFQECLRVEGEHFQHLL
jgi:hypothetical protein